MKKKEFPRITIILRNYTIEQAVIIANELNEYNCFGIEVALNSSNAFQIINKLKSMNYSNLLIGAGTVLNMELLKKAHSANVAFVLSPINMTKEMLDYCKINNIISVPGAFSPTEIYQMKNWNADIVKIFPANIVGTKYLTAIQAPLNKFPLMVVGGINVKNVSDFLINDSIYSGIGSGICSKSDIDENNLLELKSNIKILAEKVNRMENKK